MSYRWELSNTAKAAVEAQLAWYESDTRHGGAEFGDRWIESLERALSKLAEAPLRHGMAPENGRWNAHLQLRQMLFRPWKTCIGWRVLYTIDEDAKLVSVLQIQHERRRWLFEAEDEDQST